MWVNAHQSFGFLLPFGQPKEHIDLSDRHPDQASIFKLWQKYLDNVNPLLKVTHTPTLQGRIVTAATNVAGASPALIALMFSIYCVATLSLRDAECLELFGTNRHVLLTDFQLSCQQALANCGVLKTTDRECLTAFYLYVVSQKVDVLVPELTLDIGVCRAYDGPILNLIIARRRNARGHKNGLAE